MNILKKFKIINPKTGNKITIPSALASDDPNMQDLGRKKAKDIVDKAKDQMQKGGGLMKKLDKQRRKDDKGVQVKGYKKTDPYLQKVHTLKHKQPKKTEKDPNKPKADHEHDIERTMSPANKKKYDAAVKQAEKDYAKSAYDQQSAIEAEKFYQDDIAKAKEKYQDPLTPDQQAYQDYKKARTDFEKERRRGDQYKKDNQGRRPPKTPYLGRAAVEPKPDDFPGAQDFLDKQKKKSDSDNQSPFNPAGMSPDDPMYWDPEKEKRRLRKLGRTGRELSRKEAKQYIQKNKQKVFEQLLKKIIKEETKKVLNEGTRWLVGIEGGNGKILSTYGHYDGYPKHTGQLLKKIYNTPSKVKQLMKLGKQGISFLDKSMKGGKDHSFDNRKDGESIFYGRDRGEKGNMTSNWKNRDKVKFDSGEEYAYIYNLKEKKWYYKSRYSNPQDWTEL